MAGVSTKEIKNRISSVKDTQKITNAMYLIASTKLRKAKSELDHTRPYFKAVKKEIKRIFRIAEDIENKYFYPITGEHELPGSYGYLVITADKGLAGAYNQNVIKEAVKLMKEHECLEKQCKYLQKYTQHPYWKNLEREKEEKRLRKLEKKKRKEAEKLASKEKKLKD